MSMLYVDSMSHYSSAQVGQKWSSATAVTISPTGGRLGTGCAICDASTLSGAVRDLTVGAISDGGGTLTAGVMIKPASIGSTMTSGGVVECLNNNIPLTYGQSGITILRMTTAGNLGTGYIFYLTLFANGSLRVTQVELSATDLRVVDILGRSILQTAPGVVTIGRGAYVELQIALRQGNQLNGKYAVQVRVNGSAILDAPLKIFRTEDQWVSLTLGGPCTQYSDQAIPDEVGVFAACDLYCLDGVITQTNIPVPPIGSNIIPTVYLDFSTFLGVVKVEAVFPFADEAPLEWTPSVGTEHFPLIDSPVSDDLTSVNASTVGFIDQYAYLSPLLNAAIPFDPDGQQHGSDTLALPLWGIQWAWRTLGPMTLAASMQNPFSGGDPQHGPTITTPASVGYGLSFVPQRLRTSSVEGNPTPWLFHDVRAVTDRPDLARTRFGSELMA